MSEFKVEPYIDLEHNSCWQVIAPTGQGIISCASQELAKFVARTLKRKPIVEKVLQAESARIKRIPKK